MATTYEKTCPRCSGTGVYGNRGWCFCCMGAKVITITVYTPAERADRKRYAARRIAAHAAITDMAARIDTEYGHTAATDNRLSDWSVWGFGRLESDEPERFAKMLDAIDDGRLYDVTVALARYSKDNANPEGS